MGEDEPERTTFEIPSYREWSGDNNSCEHGPGVHFLGNMSGQGGLCSNSPRTKSKNANASNYDGQHQ